MPSSGTLHVWAREGGGGAGEGGGGGVRVLGRDLIQWRQGTKPYLRHFVR